MFAAAESLQGLASAAQAWREAILGAVLITGGAGYIGSHVAWAALDAGLRVVVLDDLSTGLRAAVPPRAAFVLGDVTDASAVEAALRTHGATSVLHLAGRVVASESVRRPLDHYAVNVGGVTAVAQACVDAGVRRIVFSSTAAVYGDGQARVGEDAPTRPVSPYGRSKLMAEQVLEDAASAHGLSVTALRYFNVAGADPAGRAGQSDPTATHLFRAACGAALGSAPALEVYGEDWPTRDGTGVRDFVHVADLARAHLLALQHAGEAFEVFNLGSERGFTVREVALAVGRAAGVRLPLRPRPRRAGDIAELVASTAKARDTLGWTPRFGLDDMAAHALAWEARSGDLPGARAEAVGRRTGT